MKKPKTGESNFDCQGHNFSPIELRSNSNESRRLARFWGSEILPKCSLTAEQSADLVKTKNDHNFFSAPLRGVFFFGQRAQKIPQLFQGGFQKSERALEHVFFGHFPNSRSKFE